MIVSRRLVMLLLAMLAIALVRVVAAPRSSDRDALASAIVRDRAADPGRERSANETSGTFEPELDDGAPGSDPFRVRARAAPPRADPPPAEPASRPAPAPIPVVPPTSPPIRPEIPPSPPFRVIGSYDDGRGPAVFVVTGAGIVVARSGSQLDADHRVDAVHAGHVELRQLSTLRTLALPVPAAPPR